MSDFKESLWIFAMQMAFLAIAGIALAITAIAQALPWIILALAVAVCLVSATATGCIIWFRSRDNRPTPPPVVYIIQSGQSPRLLDSRQVERLYTDEAGYVIENPKAQRQTGKGK